MSSALSNDDNQKKTSSHEVRLGPEFGAPFNMRVKSGNIAPELLKQKLLDLIERLESLPITSESGETTPTTSGPHQTLESDEITENTAPLDIDKERKKGTGVKNPSTFVDAPPFDNEIWEKIREMVMAKIMVMAKKPELLDKLVMEKQLVIAKDYLDRKNTYSNNDYIDAFKLIDDSMLDITDPQSQPLLFSIRQKCLDIFFEQRKEYEDDARKSGEYNEDYIKNNYKTIFNNSNFTCSLNIVLMQMDSSIKNQAWKRVRELNKVNPEILENLGLSIDDFYSAGIGTVREAKTRGGGYDPGEINGFYRAALFSPPHYNYAQFLSFAKQAAYFAMHNPLIRIEARYHDHEIAFPGDGARGFAEAVIMGKANKESAINRLNPLVDTAESHLVMDETVALLRSLANKTWDHVDRKILSMMLEEFDKITQKEEFRQTRSYDIAKMVRETVVSKLIQEAEESTIDEKIRDKYTRIYYAALKSLKQDASRIEDFDVWIPTASNRSI